MADVEYSPSKVDLYFPARRGGFFVGISPDNERALCAELCRLAYARREPLYSFDQRVITDALQTIGFTVQPQHFFESRGTPDGSGTHCLLAVHDERKLAIVAFRGTDASDHTDLHDDCNLLQQDWETGGKVHTGFAHALGQVQAELLPAICDPKYKTYRKIYAGHSLGAAMAVLLASLHKPDLLLTIGCPRVGDTAFISPLSKVDNIRYVDCCDAVTRVPPEGVPGPGGYAHLGPPVYIDRMRNITLDPGESFIRRDRIRASPAYLAEFGWKTGNIGFRELADHSPINYIAAINAHREALPDPAQRSSWLRKLFSSKG